MKHRIITISREFGSGGRTIGKMTATQLGIPCYDQELITKLMKESGFSKEFVENSSEDAAYGSWLANAFASRSYGTVSTQDQLWIAQREVILRIAEQESCVIVGRCADVILEDKADCLKAFIHADFEQRAKRIAEVYGQTEVPTRRRLRDKDKRRAAYYQFYADQEWGDMHNYHIALDSGVLGLERCAAILADLY